MRLLEMTRCSARLGGGRGSARRSGSGGRRRCAGSRFGRGRATGRGAAGGAGAGTGSAGDRRRRDLGGGGAGAGSARRGRRRRASALGASAAGFIARRGGASAGGASAGGCLGARSARLRGRGLLGRAFFAGLASSGWCSRISPSRSARRRRRSACCSMMVEEWLFAPTPMTLERSMISAFVIPSSLASSCIRMFFDKTGTALSWFALNRPDRPALLSFPCSSSSLRKRWSEFRVAADRALPRPLEATSFDCLLQAVRCCRCTTMHHDRVLCG